MARMAAVIRSEEHTSELQSLRHLVCRLLLEKRHQRPALGDAHRAPRPALLQHHTHARRAHVQRRTRRPIPVHSRWLLHRPAFFFFFNDTATTEIYTLSLHDALPI